MAEMDYPPTPAAVHQPLLRGHQPVAALWFPRDWLDDAQRSQRVLAHWQGGSAVWRFAQGDLLRFAAVRELQCESLGGWPLRLHGQTLCSAPLTAHEAAALPAADVWLVLGAQICALHVREAQPLDPAHWLAVDGLALHDTYDCSATLPIAIDLLPTGVRDVRDVLNGRVGPPREAQREFLAEMAKRRHGSSTMDTPRNPGLAASERTASRWSPWVAVVLAVLLVAVLFNGSGFASVGFASAGLLKWVGFVLLVLFLRRGLRSGTSWNSMPTPSATAQPVARAGGKPARGRKRISGSRPPLHSQRQPRCMEIFALARSRSGYGRAAISARRDVWAAAAHVAIKPWQAKHSAS
jgi:hypothetical protein